MTKVWDLSKNASLGRLAKKVTRSDEWGGNRTKASDATHSKKNIYRVTGFLNDTFRLIQNQEAFVI